MARTVERRTGAGGVARIAPAPRFWRWTLVVLGALGLVGPILLGLFVDLPPVVFAIPQMVIWMVIWTFFRRLDAPRRPPPPAPPPGSRARVIRLREPAVTRAFDEGRRAG
jgi:hypothetical protein